MAEQVVTVPDGLADVQYKEVLDHHPIPPAPGPSAYVTLLAIGGGGWQAAPDEQCRKCGEMVKVLRTTAGRKAAFSMDGATHIVDCGIGSEMMASGLPPVPTMEMQQAAVEAMGKGGK